MSIVYTLKTENIIYVMHVSLILIVAGKVWNIKN